MLFEEAVEAIYEALKSIWQKPSRNFCSSDEAIWKKLSQRNYVLRQKSTAEECCLGEAVKATLQKPH